MRNRIHTTAVAIILLAAAGGTLAQTATQKQKLTIEQAIAAYTIGSAFAEFAENDKGTLAAGMLADFVVLDRDLIAVPPAEILGTKVLLTVVGGKTAYEPK